MSSEDLPLILSREEVDVLREALDAYRYWEISEEQFRNNGAVVPPGTTDPDDLRVLEMIDTLEEKLS